MPSRAYQKPKRLVCNLETVTEHYGCFFAQPFERGFGTTIGNAMRRTLLSSIEGAAITAIKMDGVLHEFTPIPGVREDATDIIMNLKQIPIKLHVSYPKTIFLESTVAGALKSGDIKTDPDVEIVDKNIHIATVSEGGNLRIEMRVCRGRGYVVADENYDDDLSLGYIPIDSIHSPVRKVNYSIEAARLGQTTDYEKLILEVWTNGCLSPKEAILQAAKTLKDHMLIFTNFEPEPEVKEETVSREKELLNENLRKSIDDLELSVRAYNCLKNASIKTVADLVQKTEAEMLKTKNFGRKSLTEIKDILTQMNLSFGMVLADGKLVSPEAVSEI